MTNDLRGVSADEYWRRFEAHMGADGLLTYRYLGRRTAMLHGMAHDTMRIRSDMRGPSGAIMAAPLAIASAEAGGFSDVDSVPAPVTAGLHILDDGRGVDEIAIHRTVIHTGRTMGFSQSRIVDAADPGRLIATSYGTGIRLADAPPGFTPLETTPEIADRPDLPPLHAMFGARRLAEGQWELPAMTAESMSTSGSLHLGPIHVAFEAAAAELAARQADTDRIRAEDWHVMFVARGTHGPFRVEGEAGKGNLGRIACNLTLRDAGRGDRIVASLVATFRAE
jgi:hypothetical protein